ncbi:MAG: hypothetical protein KIS89_10860, partial [Dokdonella sp.]|nr:hypothetical protein [Dokdonella sp.]
MKIRFAQESASAPGQGETTQRAATAMAPRRRFLVLLGLLALACGAGMAVARVFVPREVGALQVLAGVAVFMLLAAPTLWYQ